MLAHLADACLVLLEYLGGFVLGVFCLVYAAGKLLVGTGKRRRAQKPKPAPGAPALRAWADIAFPAVRWDEANECYRQVGDDASDAIVPAPAQDRLQVAVPVPATPARRHRHGFERRR